MDFINPPDVTQNQKCKPHSVTGEQVWGGNVNVCRNFKWIKYFSGGLTN